MNDDILIRPFAESDHAEAADIMLYAFQSKFAHLLGLKAEELRSVFQNSGLTESKPFPGYFVAEHGGDLAGILVLNWQGQQRPKQDFYFSWMHKTFGLWANLKMMVGLAILDSSITKGECYIDHIAVSPKKRGLGIGTSLLNFARNYTHAQLGLDRLTLSVTKENGGAVRLYERFGFQVTNHESSLTSWLCFGLSDWYKMEDRGNYTA